MGTQQFLPHNGDVEIIDDFDETFEEQTDSDRKTEEFASAMRDVGSEGEVLVKRQSGTGKEPMEHVGYYEPDQYTFGQLIEHLQRTFGGGLYRIYLRKNNRNKGNKLVKIADRLGGPDKGNGVNRGEPGGELAQTMQVIMTGMRQQNQMLAQLMHGGQSRSDMLDEMLKYKQLFGDTQNNNGLSVLKDSVGLLNDLGITVGGEKDAGFTDLLEKMTPVIESAVSQPTAEVKKPVNTQELLIKAGLKQLIRAAKRKADESIYAQLILDQFPADKIQELFTNTNALSKLYEICPPLAEHKPWVVNVLEHIKGSLGMDSIYSAEYDVVDNSSVSTEPDTINATIVPEKDTKSVPENP